VREACRRMHERHIGAVLVTDKRHHLVGIFTGRDAVCRVLAAGLDPSKTPLSEVMTAKPITMEPSTSAIDALRLMQDCGCRHLPVLRDRKIVGIVSRGDFRGLEQARLDEETGLMERIW